MKNTKTQKVVINTQPGGFWLSHKAVMRYAEIKGIKLYVRLDESTRYIYHIHGIVDINNDKITHFYSTKPMRGKNWEKIWEENRFEPKEILRNDFILIRVVEELKEYVNSPYSDIKVIEIPQHIDFGVAHNDGVEMVYDKNFSWTWRT